MSEFCEICGREKATKVLSAGRQIAARAAVRGMTQDPDVECYRLGYERTLARADRYQAEFAACKALLIAEQKASRKGGSGASGSGEPIDVRDRCRQWAVHGGVAPGRAEAAEQRASEARALALREAAEVCDLHAGELPRTTEMQAPALRPSLLSASAPSPLSP
jgi:hypothetical protein